MNFYPGRRTNKAPQHTPENVGRFYEQGMDNVLKNWDAAGGMFRKALDTGLEAKYPELTKDLMLYKRIKKLVDEGMLTQDLGEWADNIRLEGNEAVHRSDPYTQGEAEELQVFTELVFRYLFTLPGMLKEARARREAADPEETEEGEVS